VQRVRCTITMQTNDSVEEMKLPNDGVSEPAAGELSSGFHRFWKRLLSGRNELPPSPAWGQAQEPLLQRAHAFFHAKETNASQALAASKIEEIRRFDIAAMQTAVAICNCGTSGSLLLASYLDGHDDVIMLPGLLSTAIYLFFDHYRSLSLHDKLIAYPFVAIAGQDDHSKHFFQGEYRIAAADYHAAVNALFDVYGDRPPEFLESRRSFFLFLHIVYCVARGQRPTSPHPLIVYAQHGANAQLAKYLVADFPQARFVHTVRDPITNCSRLFEPYFISHGFLAPAHVISHLTSADMPHAKMESSTCAIRFEDLHLHLEETMGAVAAWLGLPYRSSLLESTFNSVPFVWKRGTTAWSGVRPQQAIRDSRNVSFTDRGLLFALLYEDFVAWNYPCPKVFKHASARILTCILVLLIPMKIEIITAGRVFKSLPSRGFRYTIGGLVRICLGRVAIMSLLVVELYRRVVFGKQVLELRTGERE
jgi:hypothetical protein